MKIRAYRTAPYHRHNKDIIIYSVSDWQLIACIEFSSRRQMLAFAIELFFRSLFTRKPK